VESIRTQGLREFHTRPDVSHGRRPVGAWGSTERVPTAAAGQYPESERRTPTSGPVPWQEDGAA